MGRGTLTISIDLELAWGIWDKPSSDYFARCADLERRIVRRLLASFDRFGVSATWATVGRLMKRAPRFPVSTPYGERIWYAPDLVDQIRACNTWQEIGSHSFEHVYFDGLSANAAAIDLEQAREVHREQDIPFDSFVYPRNSVAHVPLLARHGLRVFRGIDRGWHITARQRGGRRVGQAANLVDKILPITPAVVQASTSEGIVELPGSMLLMARKGLRRLARPEVVLAKASRGLSAARQRAGIFHLWFHPSNFYWQTDRQLDLLDRILAEAAGMRDRSELQIEPMSACAA